MEEDISIYKGITNEITFAGSEDISGASDVVFTAKNNPSDSDNDFNHSSRNGFWINCSKWRNESYSSNQCVNINN